VLESSEGANESHRSFYLQLLPIGTDSRVGYCPGQVGILFTGNVRPAQLVSNLLNWEHYHSSGHCVDLQESAPTFRSDTWIVYRCMLEVGPCTTASWSNPAIYVCSIRSRHVEAHRGLGCSPIY